MLGGIITLVVLALCIYAVFHFMVLDKAVHNWGDYAKLYGKRLCRHPSWLNWAFLCTEKARAERDKYVSRREFYDYIDKLGQEDRSFFRTGWLLTEERASILPEDYERWMNV